MAPQVTPLERCGHHRCPSLRGRNTPVVLELKKRGIVLRILPIRRIDAILKGEITTLPQTPKDSACALAVLVVDFHYPVLVAHRNHDVAIVWRINNCVGMGPVGEHVGMVVWVQVIELVPSPHGLQILSRSTITSPNTVVGGALVRAGVVVAESFMVVLARTSQ